MAEEFDTTKPIYIQIMEKINKKIVRNEWKAGDKLPSVREMAVQTGVNPNTIQRTYSELERMGILETRRGQGTFVTENVEVIERLREQLKRDIVADFIRNMTELGFTMNDIIASLKDFSRGEDGEKQ
ncbi:MULTISPECIES: GntR family transcriptional regulator [unclassified Geobacillus]|uniref:GntR family transcriptional regulator n=1 Tax=unclassified Geobacillus TaxID=2642459 RepID=UPI000BE2BD8C|nr:MULTISPECIES: GntR family transcriptional regulator [unclassified Geobacillus]PDM41569.1 GntR family transcriptional regulator [Parageobacillus yumthangensis]RDV22348.1 GntR family transcriptional regulator [Parageobacillus toebii]TXK91514.1 GntR family transcriptional regulator [Parageobacillus sp. SY1]PUF90038.1 GntR family transcriptional regulator [Geobacillus sp. LYN3]TXK88852.1 GntR family transcriptional regulator [Geobacillus sp. AYS3]